MPPLGHFLLRPSASDAEKHLHISRKRAVHAMTQIASSATTSPIRRGTTLAPARRQSARTSPPRPFGQPGHEVGDPGAAVDALPATINSGKITVSRADDSEIVIDPVDLHRIYPPLQTDGKQHQAHQSHPLLIPLRK
jgi:hypothetical protein